MFGFFKRNGDSDSKDCDVRLRALDSVSTNVMIADAEDIIIYMNESVKQFLGSVEKDLQKNFPHFRVDALLGSSIHQFHKNPERIRQMLRALDKPHHAQINVGGRSFDLCAIPLFDKAGGRIGAFLEWADASQRLLNLDYAAQISAIGRSQAIAAFDTTGHVIAANDLFLTTFGVSLAAIKGKHHDSFIKIEQGEEAWGTAVWAQLRSKKAVTGEYTYVSGAGQAIYLQASYTPILSESGDVYKIVLFAQDVTRQVIARKHMQDVNDMMHGVAAGAEEMSASVREIASAMAKSRDTAMEAYTRVSSAEATTARLAQVAEAMGGILTMIGNITGQINLLALNATIEAARAGNAGRGFAVVANEVKSLASQAKAATDQISQEVEGIQSVSDEVVKNLASIKTAIENVREYVSSTAAAVEEQTAVSHEISSSMQRAAEEAAKLRT